MKPKKEKEKVMKCIVETTGMFLLVNTNGEEVRATRPSVVTNTNFIETRLQKEQLKILARGLPDSATDAEFKEFLKASPDDVKLAVASFCGKFGLTIDGDKADFADQAHEEHQKAVERKRKEEEKAAKKAQAEQEKKAKADLEASAEAQRKEHEENEKATIEANRIRAENKAAAAAEGVTENEDAELKETEGELNLETPQ